MNGVIAGYYIVMAFVKCGAQSIAFNWYKQISTRIYIDYNVGIPNTI